MKHNSSNLKQNVAVSIKNVSKYYKLYNSPNDRLKEALSLTGKKYHKKFFVTNNLSLEIKKGEILGIVGKNGSGKSTLLKLISKVLTPNEGAIKIDGEVSALLELGSGLNPQFTGLENIYFYGSVLGFSKSEMDNRVDDIINFADIGEFINQPLKTYSSGMKARLGFAVATHIDPDILILDEVLSVGDVLFKRKSYAKMQSFFDGGKTIIYVSHNTNEINRLCTRVIFLLDGKVAMDGEPKLVTQYYERYLFANKKNQESILNEIKEISPNKSMISSDVGLKKIGIFSEKTKQKAEFSDEYFIENFVSQNSVEYDNAFLDIKNICIKTLDGKVVNHLKRHVRYRYCYSLKFKRSFSDVGFGMQIHSENGMVISTCGANQCDPCELIERVNSDEVIDVEWEFNCLLKHGIYYTNTGVTHIVDDESKFINRIIDGYVFKVLPSKDCSGGIVSLQQSRPKVTRNKI